jgi:hypothetical protein
MATAQLSPSPKPKTSQYTGVVKTQWPGAPYRAFVKLKGTVIFLGDYREEIDAAWVADFVKYMAYGVDPHAWPRRTNACKPPNFPPTVNHSVNRQDILRILFVRGILDAATIAARLKAYDALAAR